MKCLSPSQVCLNYLFCLGVDGVSHPSPSLPTDSNFDSLFKQFTSFIFGSEVNSGPVSTAELQASSGYRVSFRFDGVTVNLPVSLKPICNFHGITVDGLCFQYGDVMGTAGASGQRGTFWLPAPSFTADCMDTSPAGNYYSP